MGKHRTRIKIVANILSVVNANKGSKKTHIMYQAYLSYSLLTRYLNDLVNANLLIFGEANRYFLTDRGRDFLFNFNEYARLNEDVQEKVSYIEDHKLRLEKMCSGSKLVNND
jgi:predicted transcriptional regulator